MSDDTGFHAVLCRLNPATADAAGSIAASYDAGRRDGAAAAARLTTRWQAAAGVLLAATLGLSAATFARKTATDLPAPVAVAPATIERKSTVAPASERWSVNEPPLRPLPGSYAMLRSSIAFDGPHDPRRSSGPGGERPMTARERL